VAGDGGRLPWWVPPHAATIRDGELRMSYGTTDAPILALAPIRVDAITIQRG
jgi:hypothetical protein